MDRLIGMKVFNAVARLGSFSAAAEELGISRAMASKYISDLENSLGARLLNRTTRQLSLTEVGRDYFERVANILAEIQEAELSVTELQMQQVGTLKVLSPPSFGSFHLTRAISVYKPRYPELHIELILTERAPDLIEEGVDMAIRIGHLDDSSFVARQLSSSRLVVCAAPEYLEQHGVPQSPEDLENFNCLMIDHVTPISDWRLKIDNVEKIIPVSGNLKCNLADALRIAAIQGCGLVQLPSYVVGLDI
ncbi:MAG: LysR family transcriptional regulator, partial [Gammaproteobacteria bacterium]|nr:LysR family transcriptional regulator [Gammaproteobacteria bacterium]